MRNLIEKWSPRVFILFFFIKILQCLKRWGIANREDGWRKITRVYLRTEQSKFALACFGLDLSNETENIIKGLAQFFREQPATHWQLKWDRFSVQRIKKDTVDFVQAGFDAHGNLNFMVFYLDPDKKLDTLGDKLKNTLIRGIIDTYNKTRNLNDKKRPLILKRQLDKWLTKELGYADINVQSEARVFTQRILSAVFICFEKTAAEASDYRRFDPPDFLRRKHPGLGPFSITCRFNDDFAGKDIWVQCHHACMDGSPLQELLDELKKRWGITSPLKFPPSSYQKIINAQLYSTGEDKKGIYGVNKIISLNPLLNIAKEINQENWDHSQKCITLFRLFIWKLGNHPVFKGKKFLIPVNLPQHNHRERALGFVLIRPSSYFTKGGAEEGFLEFQREFNRQAKLAITRKSESYELLESFALVSPAIYALVLKLALAAVQEFVGSIGVSIINKADVFISPASDVHTDGFIALGNFFTPTEDGNFGCSISIKGPKNKIGDYLSAIDEILC